MENEIMIVRNLKDFLKDCLMRSVAWFVVSIIITILSLLLFLFYEFSGDKYVILFVTFTFAILSIASLNAIIYYRKNYDAIRGENELFNM